MLIALIIFNFWIHIGIGIAVPLLLSSEFPGLCGQPSASGVSGGPYVVCVYECGLVSVVMSVFVICLVCVCLVCLYSLRGRGVLLFPER